MKKALVDTAGIYEGLIKSFNKWCMKDWSKNPTRYDDLREFDQHVLALTEMDMENNIDVHLNDAEIALNNFIRRYEQRYGTRFAGLLWQGKKFFDYGSLSGKGAPNGAYTDSIEDLIQQADVEDYKVYVSDDNTLVAEFYDYDGTSYYEASFISESMERKSDSAERSPIDFYSGRKPLKLDKAFLKEVGL